MSIIERVYSTTERDLYMRWYYKNERYIQTECCNIKQVQLTIFVFSLDEYKQQFNKVNTTFVLLTDH